MSGTKGSESQQGVVRGGAKKVQFKTVESYLRKGYLLAVMKIRKFKISDTISVANLISKTFATFNNKEGTKKAVQKYIDLYNPKKNDVENIKKGFLRTPLFFVAGEKGKIIGIVRGTKNRVVNLFVYGEHHGKGVGKKLMQKFEQKARKYYSKEIRMRASLFAIKFYQGIGYKKTTGIRNFMGLKVQPMRKVLN